MGRARREKASPLGWRGRYDSAESTATDPFFDWVAAPMTDSRLTQAQVAQELFFIAGGHAFHSVFANQAR